MHLPLLSLAGPQQGYAKGSRCTCHRTLTLGVACNGYFLTCLCCAALQEDFLATVWDRESGGMPVPTEAPYNSPESVPAFQHQHSVAVRPDYR